MKRFEGQKVTIIDASSSNMILIETEDGKRYDVYAECGSHPNSIPFFDVGDYCPLPQSNEG